MRSQHEERVREECGSVCGTHFAVNFELAEELRDLHARRGRRNRRAISCHACRVTTHDTEMASEF